MTPRLEWDSDGRIVAPELDAEALVPLLSEAHSAGYRLLYWPVMGS